MNSKKKSPLGLHLAGMIFDCDGVMIDSAQANRFLYNSIMRALGLNDLTPEQERYAFQATFMQALTTLIPNELQTDLEAVIQSAIDYDKDVLPKIKLMPGFDKFINMAHARDLRLAIDTNRTEPGIMKVIDRFHLPPIFWPVACSTNTIPKPSPEGAERIIKAWNAQPASTLFIGDSADDREAALGAGALFAAFANPALEADIHVGSWEEMAKILWDEDLE